MSPCLTRTCRKHSQEPSVLLFGQALAEVRGESPGTVESMLVVAKLATLDEEWMRALKSVEFERPRAVPVHSWLLRSASTLSSSS